MNRRTIGRTLFGAGTIAAVLALVIAATGGVAFTVAGVRVSAASAGRALVLSLLLLAAAFAAGGPRQMAEDLRRIARSLRPAHLALFLALATVATSLIGNTWTASGPDPSAYLSHAQLWREGRLQLPVPLAADAPWPQPVWTFTQLGYIPAQGGAAAVVPITAPGMPMLMAALQRVAGHCAAFTITPLAGGLLVWLTFVIGRRVVSARAGLVAALLVATSPAVLFMLMWPMTDVAAAACSALLIHQLLKSSTRAAAGAGLAAGAGILIRPNFFVIAGAAGVWLLIEALRWPAEGRRRRWARTAAFSIAAAPAVVVVAWLNAQWFGSPIANGYGTAANLFSIDRIATNLGRYGGWLVASSPLALAGLVALLLPFSRIWRHAGGVRTASLLLMIVVASCSLYLPYLPYEEWWYLRFLLPAWPALFVAAALIGPRVNRPRFVTLIVIAAAIWGVWYARSHDVFTIGVTERRYATVARIVDANTEPSAVILTSAHSGTLRYYIGRETLRYDVLDPAWLDRAVAWLEARGRRPYLLLEEWERPIFEARFGPTSAIGRLPFPPAMAWHSSRIPGEVWLYDLIDHAKPTAQPGLEVEVGQVCCMKPR